jgi:hypothetical protein
VLVLSFRDMALASVSPVTSAAVYEFDPAPGAPYWPASPAGLTLVDWTEVGRRLKDKHVCFMVHGFNVDRDHGYVGLGVMAQALAGLGPLDLAARGVDVVIPTLWAGDSYLPVNYPFLLPDVRATAANFASFIWSAATQMSRVSFVSHSLGARVVLETIRQTVAGRNRYPTPQFVNAILTAAAVSDDILDSPDYADAVDALRAIVVVSARSDEVLSDDFGLGNAVEQALWADDAGADDALGRFGPKLKPGSRALAKTVWYDITAINPAVDQQHGDYVPAPWELVPTFPDGWSDKRERVGRIAQAALNGSTLDGMGLSPVAPVG